MTSPDLIDRLEKAEGLHDRIAASHPSLRRGQVWCRSCGSSRRVDSSQALRSGWPKCCGDTMTIDSPAEQELLHSRTQEGEDDRGER